MCRFFAYISTTEPCLLEDVLITPANSICRQCHEHYLPQLLPHKPDDLEDSRDKLVKARNSILNMDGTGIAWYSHARTDFVADCTCPLPALYKTSHPPLTDFNFRNLCGNTHSKIVFAHVRASSGALVQQSNCHPFVFGRHTFMHNGVVAGFKEIQRDMCDMIGQDEYANVLGSTDSEHLAALYVTRLTEGKGEEAWDSEEYPAAKMLSCLVMAIEEVLHLQRKKMGSRFAPSSLNIAVTDGKRMATVRFRNHASEQPPSLYWSTTAGVTLNRKFPRHPNGVESDFPTKTSGLKKPEEHGKHVIVASEPTTHDAKEWALIECNSFLIVEEDGGVSHGKVSCGKNLDAVDPNQ